MLLHFLNIAYFTSWLGAHRSIASFVLFGGMYFETLIGTNIFIPGELFLLGGSILAGVGILSPFVVIPVLYAGALLGDSTNYFIGRRVGDSLFKEGRKIFSRKNYERGEAFFEKNGHAAIFLARLIGPFNLVTPFLAGVYDVPYKTFLLYNVAGVFVGVGEFIIAGMFFGKHYSIFVWVLHRYVFALALMFGLGYLAFRYFSKEKKTKNAG